MGIDPVRMAIVLAGCLALGALGLHLQHRVVTWARTGARFRERRLVYGLLAFLLGHGITLTLGGFAFVLVLVIFPDAPATERDDFVRCMWVCFAVGPALAVLAWTSLRYVRCASARSIGRNECA